VRRGLTKAVEGEVAEIVVIHLARSGPTEKVLTPAPRRHYASRA
jgi:hypothetical protein